jgi:hypothetical protein
MGGIVWNEVTGHLVSGHKRVMTMDLKFKNNTEHPVDYDIKVEKVSLTEKEEKQQNIFMDSRSTNTEQSFDLLAELLPDIDVKEAGLDDLQVQLIIAENPDMEMPANKDVRNDFKAIEKTYEEKKAKIKAVKAQVKDGIIKEQGASYVTLSFDSYDNKAQFMEAMGYDSEFIIIKGEQFFEKIQNG